MAAAEVGVRRGVAAAGAFRSAELRHKCEELEAQAQASEVRANAALAAAALAAQRLESAQVDRCVPVSRHFCA